MDKVYISAYTDDSFSLKHSRPVNEISSRSSVEFARTSIDDRLGRKWSAKEYRGDEDSERMMEQYKIYKACEERIKQALKNYEGSTKATGYVYLTNAANDVRSMEAAMEEIHKLITYGESARQGIDLAKRLPETFNSMKKTTADLKSTIIELSKRYTRYKRFVK